MKGRKNIPGNFLLPQNRLSFSRQFNARVKVDLCQNEAPAAWSAVKCQLSELEVPFYGQRGCHKLRKNVVRALTWTCQGKPSAFCPRAGYGLQEAFIATTGYYSTSTLRGENEVFLARCYADASLRGARDKSSRIHPTVVLNWFTEGLVILSRMIMRRAGLWAKSTHAQKASRKIRSERWSESKIWMSHSQRPNAEIPAEGSIDVTRDGAKTTDGMRVSIAEAGTIGRPGSGKREVERGVIPCKIVDTQNLEQRFGGNTCTRWFRESNYAARLSKWAWNPANRADLVEGFMRPHNILDQNLFGRRENSQERQWRGQAKSKESDHCPNQNNPIHEKTWSSKAPRTEFMAEYVGLNLAASQDLHTRPQDAQLRRQGRRARHASEGTWREVVRTRSFNLHILIWTSTGCKSIRLYSQVVRPFSTTPTRE
ncbi:hypothetical protein K438DRAFT_1763588 [Mycena galopus ATCC 62051]|nr:hypothetical protein K438DRAFT_1763588 [Mycena galopus ATCC 62051]